MLQMTIPPQQKTLQLGRLFLAIIAITSAWEIYGVNIPTKGCASCSSWSRPERGRISRYETYRREASLLLFNAKLNMKWLVCVYALALHMIYFGLVTCKTY